MELKETADDGRFFPPFHPVLLVRSLTHYTREPEKWNSELSIS